jgi:hypothetical protein
MSDDASVRSLAAFGIFVSTISLAAIMGGLLVMEVTDWYAQRPPAFIQPIEPTDPVKGTACTIVTETDMMLGHTMSKMQPYFDKGLETCLALYRPNTQDYLICFCEQRK